MNDRYLFRGKRTDNGEWIYGLLGRYNADYERANIIDEFECLVPVKTETVGQYTGLTDKNGKRIFEGDVVELTDENNDFKWTAKVVFGNPYGTYYWGWNLMYAGGNPKVNTDILLWVDMEESGAFIEIIGNVTDNPELLKGE